MAAQYGSSRLWIRPRLLVLAAAVALLGWASDGAAQGTSGARIGSAGLDAGTLVGSIGAGPGLSGGDALRANRIRDVVPLYTQQLGAPPASGAAAAPAPPPAGQ